MMKWSRPEILNGTRELSRFMSGAAAGHVKAMFRAMKYLDSTPNRGLLLKPNCHWNGDPNFEFVVSGQSDSDFAKDLEKRCSVTGYVTFLCGAPVTMKSKMQSQVALSVTSAESAAGVSCVQDMLFIMHVLESIGLKVKKPMVLEMDNKGAVDLANSWSVSGRSRHESVEHSFMRELKEAGILVIKWFPEHLNTADLFTKNLQGPQFETHTKTLVGHDEYMKD